MAAKLIVWPLIICLLLTRGFRAADVAIAAAVGLLAVGWATIDFEASWLTESPGL